MLLENSKNIAEKIFSFDAFNKLEKSALLKKFDITNIIYEVISAIRTFEQPVPQVGTVISSIPPEGIVIYAPGKYTFANDIVWKAANNDCSAITIIANNVTLDMCNFSLTAVVQDNSKFITGISVQETSGITLQNGKLVNMSYYGICAESVSGLSVDKIIVDGINLNNLTQRCLTPTGIHINKSTNISVTNCIVQNMNVTADASAGIQILETSNGVVSDCSLNGLVNNDGSVQGYSYIFSSKIVTLNCTATDFQSFFRENIFTPGHTVIGFIPIFCIGLAFTNCTAKSMTGSCDDCHGFSVFLDAYITVTNFNAYNVADGVSPYFTGAKATGLEVYGVAVSIINCHVENIYAVVPQDRQSSGFSVAGSEIAFVNCSAKNVMVIDEKGNKNPALGYGTGFGWAPDPRVPFKNMAAQNVLYSGCSANSCQVGFDTWDHINSKWDNVSYENCDIKILVEPQGSRTLSGNPCSECNPPIVIVITNVAYGNKFPSV
jgi:hypothetical protein